MLHHNAPYRSTLMLSYRHAFHAGNHADVLKHCTLIQLLNYFNLKEKPYWFIDTHAGSGFYQLEGDFAKKSAEAQTGIMHVWQADQLPKALAEYRAFITQHNPHSSLRYYPGSPFFAQQLTRKTDRLHLFEMHPSEIQHLKHFFNDHRIQIFPENGFTGIKKLLPPPTRRALILIDPSYELKTDYQACLTMLQEAIKRFKTGCYVLWYPQVARPESESFAKQLKRQHPHHWLHLSLTIKAPAKNKLGLYGSGLFILNPPYTLAENMQESLIWMKNHLAQDNQARFLIEQHAD